MLSLSTLSQFSVAQTATKKQPKQQTAKKLQLAGIFASNMVLQRETDAPIWGLTAPKEKVSIKASWLRSTIETTADEQGKWITKIRTPKASEGLAITVKSGDQTIELKNVLSGEVWICSGQSNMQWKMRGFGVDHFKEDVEKAKFPNIRFCDVPQVISLKTQDDVKTRWAVCSPKSTLQFSAVAYFFGSKLHQELDVPIGLISTNWGGSAIEGWLSPEVLEKELPNYKQLTENYPKWSSENGGNYGRSDKKPKGLNQSSPGVLYNSMIKPLMPFAFRGVIWYQGESNIKQPVLYRTLFPAMIQDWRTRWAIGDFPFYYVQIAPYHYKKDPFPAAMLREAQTMALSVPNTGMAVTMDIGDETNIHPKVKKPVGQRLALLALANDYGKSDLVSSGPQFKSFKVEANKIRLDFTSIGSGLTAKGGGELTHFTIAGDDKKFVPAQAVIKGDSVIVSSKQIAKPAAVRFGWGNADKPNFTNKEGLPASSFRTDTWQINSK